VRALSFVLVVTGSVAFVLPARGDANLGLAPADRIEAALLAPRADGLIFQSLRVEQIGRANIVICGEYRTGRLDSEFRPFLGDYEQSTGTLNLVLDPGEARRLCEVAR
jgi:hypothetical protein